MSYFLLWQRKRTSPFFILPTQLWLVGFGDNTKDNWITEQIWCGVWFKSQDPGYLVSSKLKIQSVYFVVVKRSGVHIGIDPLETLNIHSKFQGVRPLFSPHSNTTLKVRGSPCHGSMAILTTRQRVWQHNQTKGMEAGEQEICHHVSIWPTVCICVSANCNCVQRWWVCV